MTEQEYVGRCGYMPNQGKVDMARLAIPPSIRKAYEEMHKISKNKDKK